MDPRDEHAEDSVRSLHKGVLDGKLRPAFTAFTAQEQKAEHGNEVIPLKLITAVHAVRACFDDVLMLRDAVDADVQKAADHDAEDEYGDV